TASRAPARRAARRQSDLAQGNRSEPGCGRRAELIRSLAPAGKLAVKNGRQLMQAVDAAVRHRAVQVLRPPLGAAQHRVNARRLRADSVGFDVVADENRFGRLDAETFE